MQCFWSILGLALFVFVVLTLIRWFEQTAYAVEERMWDRVLLLILVPFAVWFYPSRVAAGRPTPVPRHEPVRGMGTAPKPRVQMPADVPQETEAAAPPLAAPTEPAADATDADRPPPGTPAHFLGMPVIPPKPLKPAAGPDPEKMAKLRKKMREQGMLPPDE